MAEARQIQKVDVAMTGAPLISCVVPVYNGECFVAEAIESILAQTYRPIEILVVDDGSTDGTVEVLGRFGGRIRVIRQANAGPAAARSRGLDVAKGEFVAYQDADDLWILEKLELQMERLAARPEAELCTCLLENFWMPELAEEAERLRDTMHAQPRLASWQGVLARRDVFDHVGGLDIGVPQNDAREWFHRAQTMNVVIEHVDRVLVRRRVHASNWSRKRTDLEPELLLRLAERALARRRAVGPKE